MKKQECKSFIPGRKQDLPHGPSTTVGKGEERVVEIGLSHGTKTPNQLTNLSPS